MRQDAYSGPSMELESFACTLGLELVCVSVCGVCQHMYQMYTHTHTHTSIMHTHTQCRTYTLMVKYSSVMVWDVSGCKLKAWHATSTGHTNNVVLCKLRLKGD